MRRRARSAKAGINFWIVTGMSGAGKSQVINCFEDFGYFCVDNLPMALLPKMADLCARSGKALRQVALGIDVREGGFLRDFSDTLRNLERQGVNCRIIFLDSDDKTLIRRFSETRRRHPLGLSVREGIGEERRRLIRIKEMADRIIDTSNYTLGDLKTLVAGLLERRHQKSLQIGIVSFGFKYGLPADADLVWDVRFMTNPNYVEALRPKTGQHPAVKRFVLGHPQAREFGQRFFALVADALPHYIREGKSYLTIAIGCTGGRHRSVAMANALHDFLAHRGFPSAVQHRDVDR